MEVALIGTLLAATVPVVVVTALIALLTAVPEVARAITVTVPAVDGFHVAVYVPVLASSSCAINGCSPFEKFRTTVALVTGLPQSSMTRV